MKVRQLLEAQDIFVEMVMKLVRKRKPIYLNAHTRSYGKKKDGKPDFPGIKMTGWLVQDICDKHHAETRFEIIERHLSGGMADLSPNVEYAMNGKGIMKMTSFLFELPMEEFYTIKKIDGVWTIVDAENRK